MKIGGVDVSALPHNARPDTGAAELEAACETARARASTLALPQR